MSRSLLKREGGVARLEPLGSGFESSKESNAMKTLITTAAVTPSALVDEAVDEVRASFERLCLTAGLATSWGLITGALLQPCMVRPPETLIVWPVM